MFSSYFVFFADVKGLGGRTSTNEASVSLGKWRATCVPRYPTSEYTPPINFRVVSPTTACSFYDHAEVLSLSARLKIVHFNHLLIFYLSSGENAENIPKNFYPPYIQGHENLFYNPFYEKTLKKGTKKSLIKLSPTLTVFR